MSKKVLVAYASVSGSTGEVAEAIGRVLAEAGVTVQVSHVRDVTSTSGYSAVVLGSSIRVGRWLPEAVEFLDKHQQAMSEVPVAYFTTCLTMANDTEDSRRIVLAYLEPVLQQAPQIKPVGLGLFAGALDSDRLLLPMLQADLAPHGDYRDWEAIRTWAAEIRPALLGEQVPVSGPAILSGAILRYTDMSGVDLSGVDLRGADLQEANLSQADLHRANLHEASLLKAGLNWADLNSANMRGANLSGANLVGAKLSQADLSQANLSRAILNGANLSQANLSEADLSEADMNWIELSGANLSQADLSGASLGWANLKGADLSQANLVRARYNHQTEWPEDFSAPDHGAILIGLGPH